MPVVGGALRVEVDHLGGELRGVLGVGARFGGNQCALRGVVEGAGHLQRGGGFVTVQAGFAQKEIEIAAAGERGRCQHQYSLQSPEN